MKILIVSENFNNGGLETQIKTMYENVPNDIHFIFAIANYKNKVELKNAKIYTGFKFNYYSSIKEFCDDVSKLVEIINTENIDIIHAHPFYSYFPALFASQLTKKKLIYTYHGFGSYNFTQFTNDAILFYYSLEKKCISTIFSVSDYGINSLKDFDYKNVVFFPNPIDKKIFKNARVANNNKYALFSRIDIDKFQEIKLIIEHRKEYGIENIDIYGSGGMEEELIMFIKENELESFITFKGYSSNIYETLNGNYNGVIGIGRVIIEALTMGFPCILIGYKKITGFINYKIYNEIKNKNFVNIECNKTNNIIPSKIELLKIQKDINKRFNIERVIKIYKDNIVKNESIYISSIQDLFKKIENLSNDKDLSICPIYKERKIYDLLKYNIVNSSLCPYINNITMLTDYMYELFDINSARIFAMKGKKNNEENKSN